MVILESVLLWVAAGCALLLIMQYVLRTPQTAERPEFGLGRRYPVGPRKVASRRRVPTYSRIPVEAAPVQVPAEPAPQHIRPGKRAVVTKEQAIALANVVSEVPAQSPMEPTPIPAKGKKRADTMQMMLNKAISERR